jgi:hypothetical protein
MFRAGRKGKTVRKTQKGRKDYAAHLYPAL